VFELIGETLRRLRKESGKTLAQLGAEAQVGKGQLSRIENGKQEATFGTLERVLVAHGISRQEFFRRYDLVEAEASALRRARRTREGAPEPYSAVAGSRWPGELREALARIESFVQSSLRHGEPLAQGTVEIGEVVVVFRILPRETGPRHGPEEPHDRTRGR
jgi:transcriptional regulator with XRE-family HTH domain